MTAVENGDVNVVSNFLQIAGDPNETIREWIHDIPVLYQAARHGKSEIVSLLLKHGADTEMLDPYGWRPLHIACFRGYNEIVNALIAKGADVHASTVKWNNDREKPSGLHKDDCWTGTALHTATFGGHSEILEIPLKRGVDVNASSGVTAKDTAYPAISTGYFFGTVPIIRLALYPAQEDFRLRNCWWNSGAMVQGVIQHFSLKQILFFEEFPGLWDRLVTGDLKGK
ncbi:ankyrin repeat-containing protein [Penicillium malachiteum]|nr:ankyrin repeat-containing protein [Penicillium malachiteum]